MAAKYKDKLGREWDCSIDIPVIERLFDSKTCDLYGALDNELALYKSILSDPRQLMGVVWGIVQPQGDAMTPPITIADFKKGIDGDVIERMQQAFTEGLADFFPSRKELLLAGIEKGKQISKGILARGKAALERIDAEKIINQRAELMEMGIENGLKNLMDLPSAVSPGTISESSASSPLPASL